ncbi:B12-binding domain-containing radical SAM protein, partial [Pseudomonas sp. EL_65y_Pfl2_R96]|uniref:B12-binding domain-containing radical SAM protein n=1 Tax=Pseudomonas sp. EL_65y_Pfl2_R96 TaxID=3088699 RepID=UPI0030DAE4AD
GYVPDFDATIVTRMLDAGAEIAGNWPPAWAAYISGALRKAGFDDIRFIDAMTTNLSDDQVRQILIDEKPDVVGSPAITPSIYKAERLLQLAKEIHPGALTILGGIHATFMYQQVLTEAPFIDAIVRGEGEEIIVNLLRALQGGDWLAARHGVKGIAFREDDKV